MSLSTTTLSAAVGAADSSIQLAGITAVTSVGMWLYTDSEAFRVTALPASNGVVQVQRGVGGSRVLPHASGLTVYIGQSSQFYTQDPEGLAPSYPFILPWINVVTGTIWNISGSAWVPTGGSSGGDVTGPSSSTDGAPALFSGTTGTVLKDSTPTGTGNPVLATSPTIVTPTIATITGATSVGGSVTSNAGATPSFILPTGKTNTGTVVINGKTSGSTTLTTADATAQAVTVTTAAQTSGAATLTIPDMAGVNKTVAWLESPAFTTPNVGVATATSINKMAVTAPATSSTLAVANGKTLTASNTLTLAGTDSTTMTFPGTSANIPGAVGVSYKIARGITALGGSNPTTVATGLTTITGLALTLDRSTALTSGTAFVTFHNIAAGSFDMYGWIIAGTASTGTENVAWVAIGT